MDDDPLADPLEDDMSEGELDDEELPGGWEERITDDGKVYYVCHAKRTTQWNHPMTNRMRILSKALPKGWEKQGDGTFYDTVTKAGSSIDPRLLRAPKHSDFIGFRERINEKGQLVRTLKDTFQPTHTADDVLMGVKLDGKVALVTGANSGLGFEVARSLAQHGTHVIMACRCLHKGHMARKRIVDELPGCLVDVMEVDLASQRSVRLFADDFKHKGLPLHMLVCNAAVLGMPYQQTEDGIEYHFAVNHLSHFLLAKLLMPIMEASAPCRVVVVTSESHRFPHVSPAALKNAQLLIPTAIDYTAACAYNATKACNLLFMKGLNERHCAQGIFCNAVHPGNLLATSLYRHSLLLQVAQGLAWPFTRSIAQAAAGVAYCAGSIDLEHVGGHYFIDQKIGKAAQFADDAQLASDLWALSESLVSGAKLAQ